MKRWPFTPDEWKTVQRLVLKCVYSTETDGQEFEYQIALRRLRRGLRRLRDKYGCHPVLLETLADSDVDETRSIPLYRRALRLALRYKMETHTIRLALAGALQSLDPACHEAEELLRQCKAEVWESGDEYYIGEWIRLSEKRGLCEE